MVSNNTDLLSHSSGGGWLDMGLSEPIAGCQQGCLPSADLRIKPFLAFSRSRSPFHGLQAYILISPLSNPMTLGQVFFILPSLYVSLVPSFIYKNPVDDITPPLNDPGKSPISH